jgi:hypothetical protein
VLSERRGLVRRAVFLAWVTVGWNVLEGFVAIAAAFVAGSRALLGFGLDSAVESISGTRSPRSALSCSLSREGREALTADHADDCC